MTRSAAVTVLPGGSLAVTDGASTIHLADADSARDLARQLLDAVPRARQKGVLWDLTFPGDPRAKSRPKLRWYGDTPSVYTPSSPHEEALGQFMAYRRRRPEPTTLPIEMVVGFARSDRHRIDGDNLLKLVFDAGNEVLWADDSQIRRCTFGIDLGVGARNACTRIQVREFLLESAWPWS